MNSEEVRKAILKTSAMLHASAVHRGLTVTGDRRVNEKTAAYLLGYSAGHFKALRQQGNGPMHYTVGVAGSRISYKLDDLASWIEMARDSSNER